MLAVAAREQLPRLAPYLPRLRDLWLDPDPAEIPKADSGTFAESPQKRQNRRLTPQKSKGRKITQSWAFYQVCPPMSTGWIGRKRGRGKGF